MSTVEILDYRYTATWNLDAILNDAAFNNSIATTYPLVVSTETGVDYKIFDKINNDFASNKKFGRPSQLWNSSSDSVSNYVANKLRLSAENFSIKSTCTSGAYALYVAGLVSLDKQSPVVIFCGDSLTSEFELWKFRSYAVVDQQTGIPFDKASKGIKSSSGATVMLVKHSSVKCNIDPVACIKNFHFYTDPTLIAGATPTADLLAQFSKIKFDHYDFWNAHATGTSVGDTAEYNIFNSFCQHDIPIVSFKGHVGHCMTGSCAIELAMSFEQKKQDTLLPNVGITEKRFDDPRIITQQQQWPGKNMLKASFGFGGKSSILEVEIF